MPTKANSRARASYRVLIDGLYAGETDIDCQIAVTYQDGRQGVLRAKVVGTDVNSASSR
jgi:long-chain acyl-CoA synthetase